MKKAKVSQRGVACFYRILASLHALTNSAMRLFVRVRMGRRAMFLEYVCSEFAVLAQTIIWK
uniref:Uncharacterized protein n=1 Tax=Anguilla anguilla TaxID=7936 RepID=A0A0E9U7D0_ANGAN